MQIRVFYPYFAALFVLGVLFWYWLRHTPRRLSPLRRRLLLGVRLAVLVLMVAARQQALDFVRAVSQHKPPQDDIGLVVFGADAVVEQGVSQQFTLSELHSQVEGTATNIARAIQVGIASFPSEGARRLVLLSDGNENVGSAAEAALIARSLDVQLFSLPLGRPAQEP